MGVRTKIFGPHAWIVFEGLATMYDDFMIKYKDDENKLQLMRCYMTEIMFIIGFVLPCVYCRISYREFTNPDNPDKPDLNIYKQLLLVDGAKKLVHALHTRVNNKLENQELNKAVSSKHKIKEITAKWSEHNITYKKAINTRFQKVTSLRFWHAFISFLGYVMCDFREHEHMFIFIFINTFGKMMVLDTGNIGLRNISSAYTKSLDCLDILCQNTQDLHSRIDIVWSIQKYVFIIQDWKFSFQTPKDFETSCEQGIVKMCDKKR